MTFLVATKTRLPPSPWAFMTRSAARATRKCPVALTAKLRSQSASAIRSIGAEWAMPAFETTTSSPPYASTVAETAPSTEASEVTSMRSPSGRAGPASGAISSATRRAPVASTSVTTTWAPSRASRRDTARPIPLAPPVTSATRRASSFSGGAIWSL